MWPPSCFGDGFIVDIVQLMFPGSIEHFRALMFEFGIKHRYRWVSSRNETLAFWNDPSEIRASNNKSDGWDIILYEPDDKGELKPSEKRGVIQAFGKLPNQTFLSFYDGKK